MKKQLIIAIVAVMLMLSGGVVLAQQQGRAPGPPQGQGYGQQGQGWICPWCGRGSGPGYGQRPGRMHPGRGIGPGKMQGWHGRGQGRGMQQGWQGRGQGRGQGSWQGRGPGQCPRSQGWGRGQHGPSGGQQAAEPLTQGEARQLAESYVAGNPNLKVGQLTEQEDAFQATVVTQDGSLVEKLLIDKETGWMKREY